MATPPSGGGYGRDNVTGGGGDRINFDLGVTPDMGSLVQNMTVVNQMLDDAQSKFDALAQTIGSTTQRMNELSRATELYIQQTGRIKADFSSIVQSGQAMASGGAIGYAGADATAGGDTGGVAGVAASRGAAQSAQIDQQMVAASTGQENPLDGLPEQPQEPLGPKLMNLFFAEGLLRDAAAKGTNLIGRIPLAGSHLSARINFRRSLSARAKSDTAMMAMLKRQAKIYPVGASAFADAQRGIKAGLAQSQIKQGLESGLGQAGLDDATISGITSGLTNTGTAAAEGASAGFLGPAAVLYGGYKIGSFLYNTAQQSQVYSSLTGRTNIANTLGYENRIRLMSVSPFLNSQQARQIVMGTLQAGYVGHEQNDIMNYLAYNVKKGLTDIGLGLKLYQTAVSDAGGSISSLNIGLKTLRDTATQTDASVQSMTQNFAAMVGAQTSIGIPGSTATAGATLWATAFANAPSKILQNYQGPDVTSPIFQSLLAAPLHTNVLGVPYALSKMSAFAQYKLERSQMQAQLFKLGLRKNMTPEQVFAAEGGAWATTNGPVLASLGIINSSQIGDTNAITQIVSGLLNDEYSPQKQLKAQEKKFYGKRGLAGAARYGAFESAIGQVGRSPMAMRAKYGSLGGAIDAAKHYQDSSHPLQAWYARHIAQTGDTLPWLQGLIADQEVNNELVRDKGKYYSVYSYLTASKGNLQRLMSGKAKMANISGLKGDMAFSWSQQHGGPTGQVQLTAAQRRALSFTETAASLVGSSPEALTTNPKTITLELKPPADKLMQFVGPDAGKYIIQTTDQWRKTHGQG